MKYFHVIVTHVTDCVIQAEDHIEAAHIAANLDSGDAVYYESVCTGELEENEVDDYKRHADYISEVEND